MSLSMTQCIIPLRGSLLGDIMKNVYLCVTGSIINVNPIRGMLGVQGGRGGDNISNIDDYKEKGPA